MISTEEKSCIKTLIRRGFMSMKATNTILKNHTCRMKLDPSKKPVKVSNLKEGLGHY